MAENVFEDHALPRGARPHVETSGLYAFLVTFSAKPHETDQARL